ncbi:MAG TPA: hypothetical protein VGD72_03590 [Mycobacteriales bacterium]|jgi:hypothetical protein
MTGDVRVPVPVELRERAARAGVPPAQVTRFRPRSWERALAFVPEACALLRDVTLTGEVEGSELDRTVERSALTDHLATIDLTDRTVVLSSFTLVVAWGAGTTNTRSLRYTPQALADPYRASGELAGAIERLRADDIVGAYRGFRLPGIGQSFATRWFALAGRVAGRPWQPLILDAHVRLALDVMGVPPSVVSAGRRTRAGAYEAYVEMLHEWAQHLRSEIPECRAETLEWLLASYGRASWKRT